MTARPIHRRPVLAYLDLLGTAFSARNNPSDFSFKLQSLRDGISVSCLLLDDDDKVILQNSSVYVRASSPTKIISFLRSLRSYLLAKAIFLQAVVTEGDFSDNIDALPTIRTTSTSAKERSLYQRRQRIFIGHSLGQGTATAFAEHYRFTGIGIKLATELVAGQEGVIESFYAGSRARIPEPYKDIAFTTDDCTVERLDNLCHEYVRLRSRYRSVGTHFVPLFITLIRSADWAQLEEPRGKMSLQKPKPTFESSLYDKILSPWYARHFADVPFKEFILYALINALFHERDAKSRFFRDAAMRGANEQYFKKLEDVPDSILSGNAREALLSSALEEGPRRGA